MTTNRKDSSADQKKADSRKPAKPADHRLRGEELDKDFADAEGDSCVVAPKRDYKESDS